MSCATLLPLKGRESSLYRVKPCTADTELDIVRERIEPRFNNYKLLNPPLPWCSETVWNSLKQHPATSHALFWCFQWWIGRSSHWEMIGSGESIHHGDAPGFHNSRDEAAGLPSKRNNEQNPSRSNPVAAVLCLNLSKSQTSASHFASYDARWVLLHMNDSREQAYRNCPWSRVRGSPKHILVRLNADGLRWSDKPSDFTTHWSQHPSKNHKSTDLVQPRPHKDVTEWYTHIVCMDSLPRRTHRKAHARSLLVTIWCA